MSMLLQQEVADYQARRGVLAGAISDYADWMDRLHGIDIERTLHLNDTAASLKKDRLLVAFVTAAPESSKLRTMCMTFSASP